MTNAPQLAAGWYQDPKDASQWRWWDGQRWTQDTSPMQSPQAAATTGAPHLVGGGPAAPATYGSSPSPAPAGGAWGHSRYLVHQKVLAIGSRYELFAPTAETLNVDKAEPGELVAFVQRKRVTIKERISFKDAQEQEVFAIVAPKALNFTHRYELRTPDGATFAYLKKNMGLSFWRTSWKVLDAQEREVAVAREASGFHAFTRRFAGFLPFGFIADMIPYNFTISAGSDQPNAGTEFGSYRRRYGVRDRYDLDLRGDAGMVLDRRSALAIAIALDVLQNR